MKENQSNLFQIGEVTKILNITRKTLLIYEENRLLTPAYKNEESGYRYYSADNITQIRFIRSMQELGLTLKEIYEYSKEADSIEKFLERLTERRETLDKNIKLLRLRGAKQGDLTVHRTRLPSSVCFCREFQCENISDAANKLRETYIAAAKTGKIYNFSRMFTVRTSGSLDKLKILCCIPVEDSFSGPERMEFPPTEGISIYYRGPYEGLKNAMRELFNFAEENGLEPNGAPRSIFLEGPPNRQNKDDYITEVALPIK